MVNMSLLMPGVNMAVPLAECDGTMSNMTLLMPRVYLAFLLSTMVNMTLIYVRGKYGCTVG